MKAQIFILLFFLLVYKGESQTDGGLLLGIQTVANTTEMNAIISPEAGSLVFNQTDNRLHFYNGTVWVGYYNALVPYITEVTPIQVNQSLIEKVIVTGVNFTPSTVINIPNYSGTFTFNVISNTQIELTSINPKTLGLYNIQVTTNGLENTTWATNGEGKLEVIKSDGTSAIHAGKTCKAIFDDGYATGDGMYWINPTQYSHEDAFVAKCDMTNGGWTAVEYEIDLPVGQQFDTSGDKRRWLHRNFFLKFTDEQINAIRTASIEAKQIYVGQCRGVIHYRYKTSSYGSSFGFRFHTGYESNYGVQNYNTDITVLNDGCVSNGTGSLLSTSFEIKDLRLPITNVNSVDNDHVNEKFGALLVNNPAWFK